MGLFRRIRSALFGALLVGLSCGATALPISFTVSLDEVTLSPSGTASFTGTIINQSGLDLRASDFFFEFSGFSPVLTPTQILGSSDFSLPNNTFSQTVHLFDVDIDPLAGPGRYMLDVSLQDQYGDLGNALTVTVVNSVDEPATAVLFAAALGFLPLFKSMRRRASAKMSSPI